MSKNKFAFGIDIGGTNTKIGLFDENGKLYYFKKISTSKDCSPEKFIEEIGQNCTLALTEKLGISLGNRALLGVGVGAPMANFYTGEIEDAPNLGWKNVPLKNLFSQYFKSEALIENDANLAALGESKWGTGKDLSDFILITLGTGVGTGLILNNKLYRGNNGLGGEGGHILIPHHKKRPCSCGGTDHLESYLSAKGIKQTIYEITAEEWSIEKLGQLFKEGNREAGVIMDIITSELVSGLVSISVLLGPQAFIIGGGVSKLGESFNRIIETKLNNEVHYSLQGKLKIYSASVSAEQGAIHGGAALIFDRFK